MNKFFKSIQDFITSTEGKYYDFNNDKPTTVQDYIENRFKDQLKWYEDHAKSSMIKYYSCHVVIVFFGAIIPIINVFSPDTDAFMI
jgi:Protein of unknown function (DUF4231)